MADLTGPTASYIKLVSSDDHEFIIRKDVALTSGHEREKITFQNIFIIISFNHFSTTKERSKQCWVALALFKRTRRIRSSSKKFPLMSSTKVFSQPFFNCKILLVCHYFTYKARYTNSAMEIPEFPIAPEVALELLMAANFLDCWRKVWMSDKNRSNPKTLKLYLWISFMYFILFTNLAKTQVIIIAEHFKVFLPT